MKDTVKSILENSRKQQIRKLNKQKSKKDSHTDNSSNHNHHHSMEIDDDILIGDHSNEEFDIIVDDGYAKGKEIPTNINITPLQIAASEYIGTSLQKYLIIVELLVSYGANIHAASWFTTQPRPEDQQELDAVSAQIRATGIVKDKCLSKINELEMKPYDRYSDQNVRMNDVKMMEKLHQQIQRLSVRQRQLIEQQLRLKEACTVTKMVNDSAYVMALKQRQQCNDTALIEAMVKGSLVIKKSIYRAKGVGTILNEEIIQVIVEYCNGLSLKLWDV